MGEERLRLGADSHDRGQGGLPRRGEPDTAAGALQQGDSHVALQLAELLADRGGGAVEQPRGRSHRAGPGDGRQGEQGRDQRRVDH